MGEERSQGWRDGVQQSAAKRSTGGSHGGERGRQRERDRGKRENDEKKELA